MERFDEETRNIMRRLQNARIELMQEQPFYAVLLLHMKYSLDLFCDTAYTDGERIAFSPDFINYLTDDELKFVLMHEVMHAALDHVGRGRDFPDHNRHNIACDIVVNSNIMHSFDDDLNSITIHGYGESMHLDKKGKEGYLSTVEEIYAQLPDSDDENSGLQCSSGDDDNDGNGDDAEENGGSGNSGEGDGKNEEDGSGNSSEGDGKDEEDGSGNSGEGDSKNEVDGSGNSSEGDGKDGEDGSGNSGEGDGKDEEDGSGNSSEDVEKENENGNGRGKGSSDGNGKAQKPSDSGFDDHSHWEDNSGEDKNFDRKQVWLTRMMEAAEIARQISVSKGSKDCGNIPLCAGRIIKDLTEPQTDWREILDNFIQEEINDYSFNPPDRRFQDSPFLLPDFNEKDDSVEDILFMIDTSGSMSDDMITQAYSEIKGAIDQFDGKLKGWLGFFDAKVVKPKEFTDESEFMVIRPEGGGGTNFECIFEYVKDHREKNLDPQSIVILTDGYAPFPDEKAAMDIPVLWIINNESAEPPWGKVARIKGGMDMPEGY